MQQKKNYAKQSATKCGKLARKLRNCAQPISSREVAAEVRAKNLRTHK